MGIEPTSSAWKADILADVRYPHLQRGLYHGKTKMSSPNLKKPGGSEHAAGLPADGGRAAAAALEPLWITWGEELLREE